MKAVLLVGGRGTRLRPLTFAVPKPLLAIGEKPMLQLIMERLRDHGIDDLKLATGYLAELIEAFCGDGSRFGVRVTYHRETEPLGTAGPLSLLRDELQGEDFFILMNGDVVTDIDFRDLVARARALDHPLTVAYVKHTYRSRFGVLRIEDDEILEVIEKPEVDSFVSSGIYVLKGEALRHVPDSTFFTVPHLMEAIRSAGGRIGAYRVPGYWVGVEDLNEMERVRQLMGLERDAGTT